MAESTWRGWLTDNLANLKITDKDKHISSSRAWFRLACGSNY